MSKGSARRPQAVNDEELRRRWDRAFGHRNTPPPEPEWELSAAAAAYCSCAFCVSRRREPAKGTEHPNRRLSMP